MKSRSSPALSRHVDDEDIVQSVFRIFFNRACQGLYDVPRGEDLWKLLFVLAMNKIRRQWAFHTARKRDLEATISVEVMAESLKELSATKEGQPHTRLLIREILDELSPLEQDILELRMEGYKVDEIALKVSCSKRTVERTLQQMREYLKQCFEEQP